MPFAINNQAAVCCQIDSLKCFKHLPELPVEYLVEPGKTSAFALENEIRIVGGRISRSPAKELMLTIALTTRS